MNFWSGEMNYVAILGSVAAYFSLKNSLGVLTEVSSAQSNSGLFIMESETLHQLCVNLSSLVPALGDGICSVSDW